MTTQRTAALQPITVSCFQNLIRTGVRPIVHSAEFRLLSSSHNAERRLLELNCFREGRHLKATLGELEFEALKPYIGQTIRADFQQTSCGLEPLLCIQNLMAAKAADPLATYQPLWLDPAQTGLFSELCRLVGQLDAPYRELVQQVFRDDDILQAFLDRPASLGFHHSERGGLLAHTLEVALDCEQACKRYPCVNASLTVTAALLHDIGKCHEYLRHPSGRYERSQMGTLEMHKTQGVRIVTIAAHLCQADALMVSEICHILVAANGQQYMGLPTLKMAEAAIVQSADGRSASVNLHQIKHRSAFDWGRFEGQYRAAASMATISK
ncbi:MAG: HDIG domain-containing metalloprotein [Rhodoferax sp.]